MSEQQQKPKSFMQELDEWCEGAVINPLLGPEHEESLDQTVESVKKAIRAKVLESYHNGQRTPAHPQKGGRYGR